MRYVALSLLLLVPLSATAVAGETGVRRPNVVLILADDLGYADLGVQGCRDIPTPAIDSIAAAGIRFTDGYVPCPVCAPTRAGLLTGRYPQRFGFEHNPGSERSASPDFGIPREEPILAERLKAAGYATGMVGKWHVGYRKDLQPPSRGFDAYFGFLSGAHDYLGRGRADRSPILRGFDPVEEAEYLTDAFAREAVAFVDAHHERPFFLYVPFNAVHAPLQATQRYRDRFPEIQDPKRLAYAAMLAAMDDAVGAILAALRRHGIEEDTLVVFLSDNGGPTQQTTSRNDPLRGFKGQVYEGGIRIPFLVQWKGVLPSGGIERRPVIALDVLPTVLAAAGVPVEGGPPLDGVNLLPFLRGEREDRPHEALFWRMGRQSAVRLGDLKLVVRDGALELFDLAADVGESRDVAPERPGDVARLQAALAAWGGTTEPARWVRNDRARGEARGRSPERPTPLFERTQVPGLTDVRQGTNGLAVVDLDRDGRLDLVLTQSAPRGTARAWTQGESLRVLRNEGSFRFRPHDVQLVETSLTPTSFARGQVPNLADFDGDGLLDLFVTRHAPMTGGAPGRRNLPSVGNSLLLAAGRWDRFRDVSDRAGLRNETAYNRQPSFGDVDRDGWLDVAIGCDNIKNAMGGVPWSRLYVFRPAGKRFEDGRFEDIGGTDLVPDFGGFYHDADRDRASPQVSLRDLDNDGDLDLIQGCHVDVQDRRAPFSPIEYRQGMFCWRNLLAETGALRFEKVTGNGLASEARLRYDPETDETTALGEAPGLPYVAFADTDNDGDLDVLAVGPASPSWAPRAEYVGGRFWRNEGEFHFTEATQAVGFSALGWTYGRWAELLGTTLPRARPFARIGPEERMPYFADAVFGDYDNDGWIDVVVLDRSEGRIQGLAVLFLNRGDGTFEPAPPAASGLDASGICGEAADLDGDGLLDLVFAADPDNSGLAADPSRYEDRVYRNTGSGGARANHWLRLRFAGAQDAALIGARVEVREPGTGRLLGTRWVHANQSYKSGGALEAHFGLGGHAVVDVQTVLPSGRRVNVAAVAADRFVELDLATGVLVTVAAR